MRQKNRGLVATRIAIGKIRQATLRRDLLQFIGRAEEARGDREQFVGHLAALATVAHCLKGVLSQQTALALLTALFADAADLKIARIGMHQRFEDHYCPTSGRKRGICQPREDSTCYDNGLGSCISG